MVRWLLFVSLLHLLKPTYEQVGNAAVIKNSNRDSQWMSASQSSNNHTLGTTLLNEATGGHLNIPTSYKVGKTQLTTDSRKQWPFNHSDEDRNKEFTCSQPWFYPKHSTNGSVICECGNALGWSVQCTNETQLQVLNCYCMTYNEDSAAYVLGSCYYTCFLGRIYYSVPSQVNSTELNIFMCGGYHRDDQLCGKCKHGFAPSVYSYSLACVECSNYTMNWIKYIAVVFLPLTMFLVVIVVFRLSVTSGLLSGFVLVTQLYSLPAQLCFITSSVHARPIEVTGSKILLTLYGCWNLDFFT